MRSDVPRHHVGDVAHRGVDAFFAQRRDRVFGDATRHDVLAHVGEIGFDVQRKAVHRATARETHTDRADLARASRIDPQPHTRVAIEARRIGDTEFGQRIDDHLFDAVHIRRRVGGAGFPAVLWREGENRISDQLPRAVVRHVAAAVHLHQLRTHRVGRTLEVLVEFGAGAVGEDVWVLEQQQVLTIGAREQCLLQRERLAVGHAPQPADVQRCGHVRLRARQSSRGSRGST